VVSLSEYRAELFVLETPCLGSRNNSGKKLTDARRILLKGVEKVLE